MEGRPGSVGDGQEEAETASKRGERGANDSALFLVLASLRLVQERRGLGSVGLLVQGEEMQR